MATVVLLGTLDTKGNEYDYLRARLRELGVDVVLVDAGVFEPLAEADVTQDEVAAAAGADLRALREAGDRGAAVEAMCRGSAVVAARLHAEGRLDGILSVGGSGNSSIGAAAMAALPVGVPKLIVSTVASGRHAPVRRREGRLDDLLGRRHLRAEPDLRADPVERGRRDRGHGPGRASRRAARARPLIGATMFGVTTPGVTRARERLEELGYEVLVFHATGTGGQSMEALARGGFLVGVLDVTTTELADDLVGGVLSAGPGPARGGGRARAAAGRLARRARHGQLRPARDACRRSSRTGTCTSTTRRSR